MEKRKNRDEKDKKDGAGRSHAEVRHPKEAPKRVGLVPGSGGAAPQGLGGVVKDAKYIAGQIFRNNN